MNQTIINVSVRIQKMQEKLVTTGSILLFSAFIACNKREQKSVIINNVPPTCLQEGWTKKAIFREH